MKTFIPYIFALCVLTMAACNPNYDMPGMFNGSSPKVAVRFAESMAYNDSVGVRHVVVPAADYHVYVCTDSHIDSTHYNIDSFAVAVAADTLCPFALHLGDLINAQGHMPYAQEALQGIPFFITPGNHDLYFNQWQEFRSFFGSSVYWFDTQLSDGTLLDRFICLDSAEGTLGTEQMRWLRDLLATDGYRHTVVFTHTHLFKQDNSQGHTSNYAIEETYELTSLLGQGGVDMYWCGHDHSREITHYGGFTSIIVDAVEDHYTPAFYMVADLADEITYRFVSVGKTL